MNNPALKTNSPVDVVFIDKYRDPADSEHLLGQLQEKFHFNNHIKQQLATGQPVVIKHATSPNHAQLLIDYIASLGGDCWMQDASNRGFIDRRQEERRAYEDRRLLHRAWAIVPDRRKARDRRVSFH